MIDLQGIKKAFDDHVIFDDIDISFEAGQSYALMGQSGSGKSTLLNIIGKLEKPDAGKVLIKGRELSAIREKEYFKDYISYLFQNFGLIENRTIKENLELAFVGKKLKNSEKLTQMKNALKRVNLQVELNRKIFSLSGGESQRVAIAKTILKDSPILLADEPTAALDQKNSQEIIDLILGMQNDNRLIIIATHDPNVYERMDHIIQIGKEVLA